MRVEGGSARGIELKAPRSRSVRPTTSLTRQAVFSMLENSGQPFDVVLDLFAGSGALGIEALSRGASWADFVDNNRDCCTVIRQNLERTKLSDHAEVHCISAHRAPEVLERRYDTVFMDPPYDDDSTGDLLTALGSGSILSPEALLVVSHGDRHPLADNYGSLSVWKKRRYGDSHISIYQREEQ
jgi:16S rRNA (guanine966-N2)-methyltransferase